MYAYIKKNKRGREYISAVADALPLTAYKQSDGVRVDNLPQLSVLEQEACGWYQVTETPPPEQSDEDKLTKVYDAEVVISSEGMRPHIDWRERLLVAPKQVETVIENPTVEEKHELTIKDFLQDSILSNKEDQLDLSFFLETVQVVLDGNASNLKQANASLNKLARSLRMSLRIQKRTLRQVTNIERLILKDLGDVD